MLLLPDTVVVPKSNKFIQLFPLPSQNFVAAVILQLFMFWLLLPVVVVPDGHLAHVVSIPSGVP